MAKVLVCDHEYSFRSSLRKSLESDGFSVHDISRASEALKYVLKEKFDAIVFNLQPDNMISTLIFSAIRTIDKELPVIVITDSDESLSSVSSIIHETFRYFRKPVGYREIKEAINETIILKLNSE
ncbi:MAG: response regulator [Candidatus Scalindua sediminis]|nr:response regulator [Candidatus Scalindua sediminis]